MHNDTKRYVYCFVRNFWNLHHRGPTYAEIEVGLNLSNGAVKGAVRRLKAMRLLSSDRTWRGLRAVERTR